MKKFLFLLTCICFFSIQTKAQEAKYKAIQGIGYLHTQITLLLNNWEFHPLSQVPLDEFEEEFEQHFIEELEHDEQWVEYMMVEENFLLNFSEDVDEDTEDAIEENLEFYRSVITAIKKGSIKERLADLRTQLRLMDENLYEEIFPALCD